MRAPVEVVRGRAAPFVFIVDHASNHVPAALNGLGLPPAELDRHIAWDIGAGDVARALVERMGGVAVLSGISRLVIDCNREPDHPGLIPLASDGTPIPGNAALTAGERARRMDRFYAPFHDAVGAALEAAGSRALPVSVHSFTPEMNGFARPWPIGLLYNDDDRLARSAIEWLRAHLTEPVGDNEPYSGKVLHATMNRHAEGRGLPYLNFELRQDLIATPAGVERWSGIVAAVIGAVTGP